jgi:WD40 repeat protein
MNIVTGARDGTIKLWADYDLNVADELVGHTDAVNCVCLSNDGTKLASASHDKSVRLWDMDSRRQLIALDEHKQMVVSVKFTKKDDRLLSGSSGAIILWDVATGNVLFNVVMDSLYGLGMLDICPDERTFAFSSKWNLSIHICNMCYGGDVGELTVGDTCGCLEYSLPLIVHTAYQPLHQYIAVRY